VVYDGCQGTHREDPSDDAAGKEGKQSVQIFVVETLIKGITPALLSISPVRSLLQRTDVLKFKQTSAVRKEKWQVVKDVRSTLYSTK
jgi:hypothetical protein